MILKRGRLEITALFFGPGNSGRFCGNVRDGESLLTFEIAAYVGWADEPGRNRIRARVLRWVDKSLKFSYIFLPYGSDLGAEILKFGVGG